MICQGENITVNNIYKTIINKSKSKDLDKNVQIAQKS